MSTSTASTGISLPDNAAVRQSVPRTRKIYVVASVCVVVCLMASAFSLLLPEPVETPVLTVQKAPFRIQMTTSGSLEPIRTQRVTSECQWTVQILDLVPEGTWVKKGDIVCVLDSSEIQEFQRSREVSLIKAQAALEASRQQEELIKARNERRLSEAQHELQAAELDLMEYMNGVHPNELAELQDEIAINAERLESAASTLDFTERLWMLGYSNHASVEAEALKVTTQAEQLRRLEYNRNLLQQFSHPRRDLQLSHHLNNSRLNVVRTDLANSLAVSRARMGMLSDEHRMAIYERYARAARDSIKACTLRAPCDGQVMHCNNWHLRSRGVITIEVGKSVYFSQPVFEIPDQEHLKVRLPLNESLVTQVSVGSPLSVRPLGFESMDVPARITRISPYPVQNRYSPDRKEYFLDAVLDPSHDQQEFLHPRMETEATLTLLEEPDAITLPPEAVIRCAGRNLVMMKAGDAFLPHEVQPGEVADGKVLIKSGLREGDQVASAISERQRQELENHFADSSDAGD